MKFSTRDFSCKSEHIRRVPEDLFTIIKEILKVNFIFCAVNVLNVFKISNQSTKMKSFWQIYCQLWTRSTHSSCVYIPNLQQPISCWVVVIGSFLFSLNRLAHRTGIGMINCTLIETFQCHVGDFHNSTTYLKTKVQFELTSTCHLQQPNIKIMQIILENVCASVYFKSNGKPSHCSATENRLHSRRFKSRNLPEFPEHLGTSFSGKFHYLRIMRFLISSWSKWNSLSDFRVVTTFLAFIKYFTNIVQQNLVKTNYNIYTFTEEIEKDDQYLARKSI